MILPQQERRRLVYLSPVALSSFAQRPHHFVHWFHNRFDADVLWIEPGPSRFPKWTDWNRLRSAKTLRSLGPTWAGSEWLSSIRFPTLPLEPVSWGRRMNRVMRQGSFHALDAFVNDHTWLVFGKPCDLALELCSRYPQARTVFDIMDNMPAFSAGFAGRWMQAAEQELMQRCNWMLVSSSALMTRHEAYRNKIRIAKNGLSAPPPLVYCDKRSNGRPVLGYVGVMASWFDWDSVIRLANLATGCDIHLIGPCEGHQPGVLPKNIKVLPPISQDTVYATMQRFDAGLIPFKKNNLTDYVDPVKFYEYRALGLPVLTTRFGEMRLRALERGVSYLEDIDSVDALMAAIDVVTSQEELNAFREAHQWDRHFDAVDFFQASQPISDHCAAIKNVP